MNFTHQIQLNKTELAGGSVLKLHRQNEAHLGYTAKPRATDDSTPSFGELFLSWTLLLQILLLLHLTSPLSFDVLSLTRAHFIEQRTSQYDYVTPRSRRHHHAILYCDCSTYTFFYRFAQCFRREKSVQVFALAFCIFSYLRDVFHVGGNK